MRAITSGYKIKPWSTKAKDKTLKAERKYGLRTNDVQLVLVGIAKNWKHPNFSSQKD